MGRGDDNMSQDDLREPDVVTGAFSVKVLEKIPPTIANALADLEVKRRAGTVPIVVGGDVVCLYLADFLGKEG